MRGWLGCSVVVVMLLVLVLGLLNWGLSTYYGLVRQEIQVERAWSELEIAYQRRMDLVPNFVEAVRSAGTLTALEREKIAQATEACADASQTVHSPEILNRPAKLRQLSQLHGEVHHALSRLVSSLEDHPALKTSDSYRRLRDRYERTEQRIKSERWALGMEVRTYNQVIREFPASLLARWLNLQQKSIPPEPCGI